MTQCDLVFLKVPELVERLFAFSLTLPSPIAKRRG
jgi:hypothetical protein